MKSHERSLRLSATDLSNFLACRHRIGLEMAAVAGKVRKPRFDDPQLEALFRRGLEHERAHVEALGSGGRNVVDLSEAPNHELAVERTLAAMRDGADVIVQAAFAHSAWQGRPDVLVKVATPSPVLGRWSYEVRRHQARARDPLRRDPAARSVLRAPGARAGRAAGALSDRHAGRHAGVPLRRVRRVLPLGPRGARDDEPRRLRGAARRDLSRAVRSLRHLPLGEPMRGAAPPGRPPLARRGDLAAAAARTRRTRGPHAAGARGAAAAARLQAEARRGEELREGA